MCPGSGFQFTTLRGPWGLNHILTRVNDQSCMTHDEGQRRKMAVKEYPGDGAFRHLIMGGEGGRMVDYKKELVAIAGNTTPQKSDRMVKRGENKGEDRVRGSPSPCAHWSCDQIGTKEFVEGQITWCRHKNLGGSILIL